MGKLWQLLKRTGSKSQKSKTPTNPKPKDMEQEPDIQEGLGLEQQNIGVDSDPQKPSEATKEALLADLRIDYETSEDDSLRLIEPRIRLEPAHSPSSGVAAVPYSYSEDLGSISNLEAGSDSVKRSYLSIIPTTIQIIDAKTTLFVWHATFHPAIGRRFSSVIVSCKFGSAPWTSRSLKPTALLSSSVEVKAYAPHKSYGASTKEQKKIVWGLELPVTVPAGPVSLGVTPSTNHETSKEVEHAFTITGSARGSPRRNTLVWTLQENGSTERGIPSEIQLAALVQHSGPVQIDIDIEGRTAGGFLPWRSLRPKTDAMGRRKVIDPKVYVGMLEEMDFGDRGLKGAAEMLEKWTGQVSGAVLEFDQKVISA